MKKRKFKNGTELYTGNPVMIADIEHLGAIYVDANVDTEKKESIAALIKPGHEITDTYGHDMRVKDLKRILNELPDDMLVIMPVIGEDDANHICGFRKIRTAGVLICEGEEDREALCLNAAADGQDIADQVHFSHRDVGVKEVLFGQSKFDNKEQLNKILDKFNGNKEKLALIQCRDCGRSTDSNPNDLIFYELADGKCICRDCRNKTNELIIRAIHP